MHVISMCANQQKSTSPCQQGTCYNGATMLAFSVPLERRQQQKLSLLVFGKLKKKLNLSIKHAISVWLNLMEKFNLFF